MITYMLTKMLLTNAADKKYFFSHRVINRWNALDGETVSSSSINTFKNRLNKIRMTRMGYFMD